MEEKKMTIEKQEERSYIVGFFLYFQLRFFRWSLRGRRDGRRDGRGRWGRRRRRSSHRRDATNIPANPNRTESNRSS